MGGSSDGGIPAIGSSRGNSSGTDSGGNSGSGISRSNANDGFNAAHYNTSTGTQEVGKRLKTLKDATEDGVNPAAESAESRKRGAAVGGVDYELDEGNANDIKINELRNIIGGYETAHGKYHSTSYSDQVVGGYNYLWKETSLAPMIGLRLTKMKDSGDQEYGTSFQNRTIQKRQYNKVDGILGGEIKTIFYKDEFIIRPQVHAFINYDFKGKTPAIIADLNGFNEPLPVPSPKPTKMLYDLGAGVVNRVRSALRAELS
ncbi:autotransporter outer membrane beta-barrel domain-containing protein [Candidatus Rickettsia kedanie]|uniref:Autotransporter domain-containing protein n=1 Tax=Candidatus Rickettsia kedanie TaxID=3115352 RepID=A0ABP9TRX9_9RICK